jgi:type VI secretion system protein ImpK
MRDRRNSAAADPGRLLWEAGAILALVPQIRATGVIRDLARVRKKIAAMLADFQARMRARGIDATRISQASEVLAALIDHVVTSMPWGADAGWQSLGAAEALMGSAPPTTMPTVARRATQRLHDIARTASSDAGMNELIGVALALGFDERNAGTDGAHIEQIRAQLAKPDRNRVAPTDRGLSPHWQSSVARGRALTSWLPLWTSSLVIAALLVVFFIALELSLGTKSDRLYAQIAALKGPASLTPQRLPAPQPRLSGALSAQMTAGSLSVREEIDRSVIVVPAAQLFETDNATLLPGAIETLRPIAAALLAAPGRVQIIGHTAAIQPRAARYPSDWELSVDRARAVKNGLHDLGLEAARLAHDGRAGIEPLPAGDSTRAISGDDRIEIILLAGR